MNIPGYYYDTARKKYFKITNGQLTTQSKYHNNVIQNKKRRITKDIPNRPVKKTFIDYKLNTQLNFHHSINECLKLRYSKLNVLQTHEFQFNGSFINIDDAIYVIGQSYVIYKITDKVQEIYAGTVNSSDTYPAYSHVFKSSDRLTSYVITNNDTKSIFQERIVEDNDNISGIEFEMGRVDAASFEKNIAMLSIGGEVCYQHDPFMQLNLFLPSSSKMNDIINYYRLHVSCLSISRPYSMVGCSNGNILIFDIDSWEHNKTFSDKITQIKETYPGSGFFLVCSIRNMKLMKLKDGKLIEIMSYNYTNMNYGEQKLSISKNGVFIISEGMKFAQVYFLSSPNPVQSNLKNFMNQLGNINDIQIHNDEILLLSRDKLTIVS